MSSPHQNEMSYLDLGRAYDSLEPNLQDYVDSVIRHGESKIATIKFLRDHLGINLTYAKNIYEGRHTFLTQTPNPFGWE